MKLYNVFFFLKPFTHSYMISSFGNASCSLTRVPLKEQGIVCPFSKFLLGLLYMKGWEMRYWVDFVAADVLSFLFSFAGALRNSR